MMQMSSKKLTVLDIRSQHYFDISALAAKAGVDPRIVHAMLTSQPVQRFQAELVLAVLSDETDEEYTLDTGDVVLVSEENEDKP